MANTHEFIAKAEVTSGTSSAFDFSSIPSTYTDLVLYMTTRGTGNNNGFNNYLVYLNSSSSATNRSSITIYSGSGNMTMADYPAPNANLFSYIQSTDAHFGLVSLYFHDYTSSNSKFYIANTTAPINGAGQLGYTISKWEDSSAINRIYIAVTSFETYSNAYLYGIKKS